jgi:C4-dicarboxylate-specific signal transduction histidine kinase
MINKTQKNKKRIFLLFSFLITISTFVILCFIYLSKQQQINFIENEIIKNAINTFDDIDSIREWNINNYGVYLDNNSTFIKYDHAQMTKQISNLSKNKNKPTYKITSLNPLNPANAPTPWEKNALIDLENSNNKYFYDEEDILTNKQFNFMGALKVKESCMQCHGFQGYKVGELRGGLKISIDIQEYIQNANNINTVHTILMIAVVLIAVIVYFVVNWLNNKIFAQQLKLEELNLSLEDKVNSRTKELNELNESLEDKIMQAIETNKHQEEIMIVQSRHAAMGEMISMIAHQWRQPITVISMAANNIKLDASMDMIEAEDMDSIADDILEQTHYLSDTIDDFRDFFKPNKEKTNILPQDVIEDSIKIIEKSLINNNIQLIQNFKETEKINTYPKELLQVLINIIKNAKEAFSNKSIETKSITINLSQNKKNIIIEILDNAGGIDTNIIDSIFDPYFSTKDEKNGTGLGLYMSETIIHKHLYGKLEVQNNNDGAMFTITLPIEK